MAAAVSVVPGRASTSLPLKPVADIPLLGNPTRLDYQSLDPKRHLLFVAHLGDSTVDVIDTVDRRVVATVPNVSKVHGVLVVPELNRVYASATGTNEVVAIDESTLKIVGRTDGGVYPDGIAFDPGSRHIFISDERGGTDTVIDTRTNRKIATISLGGEVGNTQYDPVSRHIFANVQTRGVLVEIDPIANAVVRRISLEAGRCAGNHGLLIDSNHRRAFIACEDNAKLLWFDMRTSRLVRSWTVGDDPDVLALGERSHRLYVAAESGTVAIFDDAETVEPIAQGFLADAAHTVATDSASNLVYFPLENVDGRPILRIYQERP